jgi:post-segregation antitoxin (ccd killing protein)
MSKAAEAETAEPVKRARETAWKEQNRKAVDTHNRRVKGVPLLLTHAWLSD